MISNVLLTRSEEARYVRAELETIVAALRLHELAELLVRGREILERADERNDERDAPPP